MVKASRNAPKGRQPQGTRSKWPLLLWVGGAVILVIAAVLAFQKPPTPNTPAVSGAPSLKLDKQSVDLGDVKLGTTVQVSFIITNVGDQPLRFLQAPYVEVKEGC